MSDQPPILIHGAGGHAKVAYTVAIASGREVIGFLDPNSNLQSLFGLPVHRSNPFRSEAENFIAIGSNQIRKSIADRELGHFATLIHPSAIIAPDVLIGKGTLVCAGAIIQTGSTIGSHTIINTKSSVDHDCVIGSFVHIAPGATLCGGITVGDAALVGAGATVLPNIEINPNATLAAGALAVEEIPRNETWVGVPAKYRP
jgi:sugar O-acyltransferase (sialic acid O-acetyltransferase NeuD family)